MFSEIFRQTQKKAKVTNRALAKEVDKSEKHISQFINGRADIPCSLLWELIEALEKLAPGSKLEIAIAMAGDMDGEKSAFLLNLIAQNLRSPQSNRKIAEDLLTVS